MVPDFSEVNQVNSLSKNVLGKALHRISSSLVTTTLLTYIDICARVDESAQNTKQIVESLVKDLGHTMNPLGKWANFNGSSFL